MVASVVSAVVLVVMVGSVVVLASGLESSLEFHRIDYGRLPILKAPGEPTFEEGMICWKIMPA